MRRFRTFYAGLPRSVQFVTASSAREAAMKFFARSPLRNSVIVEVGLLREEIFSWRDFSTEVPELRSAALPLVAARAPRESASRDPFVAIYRAVWLLSGLMMLVGAWWFAFDQELWGIAIFLVPAGIVSLAVAFLARSTTLRRMLTREPSNLDAR